LLHSPQQEKFSSSKIGLAYQEKCEGSFL